MFARALTDTFIITCMHPHAGVDHGAYMAFLQQQQQQQQAAQAAFLAQMGGGQPATGTVIPGYAAPVSPAPAN